MHQGRGLERVIGAFVAELRSCQRAEFIVDQREKPLHRGLAALAPHASQHLGDAARRRGIHSLIYARRRLASCRIWTAPSGHLNSIRSHPPRGRALYRTVQLVLFGFLAVLFGMSALSRRFPHIAWLQLFRYNAPRLSEEQRANLRQRANVHAGIELILLGIVVPMVYFASTVMMFSEPTVTGTTISLTSALLLIGLGTAAIWRNRRRRLPGADQGSDAAL